MAENVNTVELKKLFVYVPAGKTFDGATVSAADGNASKIYFDADNQVLWNRGIAYGISDELKQKISDNEDAITDLVDLIGAGSKEESAETILARIEALEAATAKPLELAEGELVLDLDASATDKTVLSSTLGINIVKHAESDAEGAAEHEYIQILGKGDAVVAEINADKFVADGMISSVEWKRDEEGHETSVLVITWNTDAGKDAKEIDMTKFIDTYTSGNEETLTVSGYVITPVTSDITEDATGLAIAGDVYAAIAAKNVDAEGETGEEALVSASAENNKVTIASTERLQDAVDKVESLESGSATIASVADGVVTIKTGVSQDADSLAIGNAEGDDITLAKVATTGEGEDVAYEHDGLDDVATVKDAIDYIVEFDVWEEYE